MENQTKAPIENQPEAITKERKKPNITPEDRAQRAERMREMATKRNELLRKQKADRFEAEEPKEPKPKTPRVKKEQIAAEPTPEPTVAPVATQQKPKEPKAKKAPVKKQVKVKTLVIQSSSDSEDYGDSDTTSESEEEEVVYIAKKSKSTHKPERVEKITKEKQARKTVMQPAMPPTPIPEPLIRVKFF